MTKWIAVTAALARDELGATAIEYALIASILSVSIIAALRTVGIELEQVFIGITAGLSG